MEYLQHDYILTWTLYEPLSLCLSCNKWSCGIYQTCWKEWNAVLRPRCYRESTYCQSTDTERHVRQYTLLKSKRHWLRCHDFLVHAYLLRMCTNVVDFRVMRRLCCREWKWQRNWQSVNQRSWDPWQWITWPCDHVISVLTVQFLPSGEHKNYAHVLTSKL